MINELFVEGPWRLLLVQGTACVAVGLAISYALRRRPAHAHQVLLTGLLAAMLMPGLYLGARYCGFGVLAPGAVSVMPGVALAPPLPTFLRPDDIAYDPTPGAVAEAAPASPTIVERVPWSIVAAAGWLTATLLLLLRLAWRFLLGTHLLRTAAPLEAEPVARTIQEAKSELGIEKSVRIRGSDKVRSPVIWCWVREPVLLLQKAAADCPRGTDWASVFCHELAHWRRRDHLSGLFAEVLSALFPWHPLLWWARGRLLMLSEQACDDWVLATGHRGEDYAQTLLGLTVQRQMAFLPTVVGREKTMKTRIRRIIEDRCSNPRIGKRWRLGVGIVVVLASVGVALAQEAPTPPPQVEPPRVQTAAPPSTRPQTLVTAEDETRLQAEAYPLRYISGQKLQALAEIVVGGLGTVVAHADRGSLPGPLLVRTTPENHRRLERLILKLDVPPDDLRALEGGPNFILTLKPVHTSAVRLRDALRPAFGKSAKISADERTNSLVVTIARGNIGRVVAVLALLDPPAAEPGQELDMREVKPVLDGLSLANASAEKTLEAERVRRVQERPGTSESGRRASGPQGPLRVETRFYKLKYVSVEKMRAILEPLLEAPQTFAAVMASQERFAITATRENHRRIARIIQIVDVPEEDQLVDRSNGQVEETKILRLNHFSTERMRRILQPILPETVHAVDNDNGMHAVIVATTHANMKRVESIIQELDLPSDDRGLATPIEELREQIRRLNEQMQQIQNRLDRIGEQEPADRPGEAQVADKSTATTRVFKLQYVDPDLVRVVVEPLLRQSASIVATPQWPGDPEPLGRIGGAYKPALAVSARGEDMARIERILAILDVPEEDGEADKIVTMTFKLDHFDPERMRDIIRPLLGKSSNATVDAKSGRLVVTAPFENLQRVKQIMAELDAASVASGAQAQIEDLRRQMQELQAQRQQIQNRLGETAAQSRADLIDASPGRTE